MSTSKRIAKRLLAVVLTIMMLMSMVTIAVTSASAAKVELAETGATISGGTTFYLKPGPWATDSAWFAMYGCNGSSAAEWVRLTPVDGDSSVYQGAFKSGASHKNIIFTRMSKDNLHLTGLQNGTRQTT